MYVATGKLSFMHTLCTCIVIVRGNSDTMIVPVDADVPNRTDPRFLLKQLAESGVRKLTREDEGGRKE